MFVVLRCVESDVPTDQCSATRLLVNVKQVLGSNKNYPSNELVDDVGGALVCWSRVEWSVGTHEIYRAVGSETEERLTTEGALLRCKRIHLC